MADPRGTLFKPRELAKLCYTAGWTDAEKLLVAVSVILAESNGYEKATFQNTDKWKSVDRGLWQFNSHWHPEVTDAIAFNAAKATAAARKLYVANGNSFGSWHGFTGGSYKSPRAMGLALDGVRNFLAERNGFPIT